MKKTHTPIIDFYRRYDTYRNKVIKRTIGKEYWITRKGGKFRLTDKRESKEDF